MALSRSEINQRSNEKRGVTTKGFKLHQDTIQLIEKLAQHTGKSQSTLITEMIQAAAKEHGLAPDPTEE